MAKSGESSQVYLSPESRTSSFTRKRTNSHLETSPRTKALKRGPVTPKKITSQDYVSLEDSSAAEDGADDDEDDDDDREEEEVLGMVQGKSGTDDDDQPKENEDDDEPKVDPAYPGKVNSNGDIVRGTQAGTANGIYPTDHDGETSDDDSRISSEDSDDSDAGTDDLDVSVQAVGANVNEDSLSREKTKKELRRERRAARRQLKLLRAQQALKRGKKVRLNGGMLELPKGGNGFIALENDDGEDDGKEDGEESEGEEEGGDGEEEEDDSGLLVGSKGVSSSPTPPPARKRKPDTLSNNNDFVPIDISSESEKDDKDLHTRRLQQKKEKIPKSISGRNAPPTHKVIEISDDDARDPPSASLSSLESGEDIALTAPILTFPPPETQKTVPRLRLLKQYYTPISPASYPYEEDRDLFGPVRIDEFRVSSPKRRKLEDDSPLREFFQRQICGVCASEGHEEKSCEKLRCKHCFAWDKHFSHACPDKPPPSAGLDSSEGESFNWRRVPPANVPEPPTKVHPTALNMGCYSCASDHHFGDDCSASGQRGLSKIPWSMAWAEDMGWIDKNAPPARAAARVREKEKERDLVSSFAQNSNQNHGNDSRRDRDTRRDRDRDNRGGRDRGRDWDYQRDIGADIRGGGGGYRSRYGGNDREASPPRGGGGYGRDNRRRSPPPPPPPRNQLPPLPREPLPPPVGFTGNQGGGGRRERRGGVGGERGLDERIRMMPSSGKREWASFKR